MLGVSNSADVVRNNHSNPRPQGVDTQPFSRVFSSSFATFLLLCLANKEEEK